MEEYLIEFLGRVPAKKNNKGMKLGRDGKMHVNYGSAQEEINRLSMQVPAYMRDLRLVHPDMEWWFEVPDGRCDRDNSITTILDILVKYQVLRNDSIKQCNGEWSVHAATRGSVARTIIRMIDTGEDKWPEKKKRLGQ